MRAGPDRNTLPVDHHRDVMGMDSGKLERKDTPLIRRRPEDPQGIDRFQPLDSIGRKIGLVKKVPPAETA